LKIVQTLVVRDEADIVGAQLEYHLNAGVDFVIATDHGSHDGTTEILESYARAGQLLRIPVEGRVREAMWRTNMARLAATEHGADWVINTDADEFWIPRGGTLADALAAVPASYGIVWALSRHFVPRPEDGRSFAERMTVRVSSSAALNDPMSPYRPHAKVAHRGDAEITISFGSHTAWSPRLSPLSGWYAADVFHFPFRTLEQYERKGVRRARGDKPLGQYVDAYRASEEGRIADRFRALVVGDAALERGMSAGSLAVDTRLRDALRLLDGPDEERPRPGEEPDASAVAEEAALRDADLVRLMRTVDGLRARVDALEQRGRETTTTVASQ